MDGIEEDEGAGQHSGGLTRSQYPEPHETPTFAWSGQNVDHNEGSHPGQQFPLRDNQYPDDSAE